MGFDRRLLRDIFLEFFSSDELLRFVADGKDGQRLLAELPQQGVSPMSLADQAAQLYCRWGHADASLQDRLIAARPQRERYIREILGRAVEDKPPLRSSPEVQTLRSRRKAHAENLTLLRQAQAEQLNPGSLSALELKRAVLHHESAIDAIDAQLTELTVGR